MQTRLSLGEHKPFNITSFDSAGIPERVMRRLEVRNEDAYSKRRFRQFAKPYIAGNPVRKVVTKSRKRVTGYVSSVKNGGLVPWESQIERDQIYLFETAADVRSYQAQPEELLYELDGKTRRYYPDFRVEYWNGDVHIVEVKCQADADDEDNKILFGMFERLYAKECKMFRVATDTEIRTQPRLINAKELLFHRDNKPGPRLAARVRSIFALNPPATLGELEERLGFNPANRGRLYALVVSGQFGIDLAAMPLGSDSPVYMPRRKVAR